MAKSHKRCMEQAKIIDMFGTYHGSSLFGCKRFTYASHPQILRYDKSGLFPCQISDGVVSIDFDEALFKVWAAVSKAYPQNDNGSSVRDIIDLTMSNRVRLRLSNTPFLCGVTGGVSCGTIPRSLRCAVN